MKDHLKNLIIVGLLTLLFIALMTLLLIYARDIDQWIDAFIKTLFL